MTTSASPTTWTPEQLPDLSGRTALVTGANSGIGLETALRLAGSGAHVVMTSRDPGRGADALREVREQVPSASVEVRPLDLADLASVRSLAASVLTDHPRLDLLVNNAGVMAVPRARTADGFELQLGTNHLGHFALTVLLLPALLADGAGVVGGPARVVTVTSMAHRGGRLDRDDLMGERRYGAWRAYGQSKLANLLFTLELQRRAGAQGLPLASLAAHPGYSATNLTAPLLRSRGLGALVGLVRVADRVVGQPAHAGALPTLRAATDPEAGGGELYGPSLGGWRGLPVRETASRAAYDEDSARWLWDRSEELTGVRLPD